MKFYRINNFYMNKNEKSYFDSSLIVVHKDDVYNLRTNILRAETAPVTILPMLKLIYKDI